ncbi:3-phosphoinositide-dependent protein kinase 1 [Reticulomyxa filosa]|uniref:non-specific serine/threonine protein kinase n=1 Tax=Reticulomyxa filosa TaxID=46433 RepID=X6P815_RETFI|nr:3-phosphoinositide-dependent protein kinase 1 [Reticulomyxa filosa]|eukprot:ETO34675.1 3-phosphoinositide-dependent protein kinase 1 [Reticulomyxa filosa]
MADQSNNQITDATQQNAESTNKKQEVVKAKKENKNIDYKHQKEDFELGKLLGGGSYAKVVEGKVTNPNSPFFNSEFAVKIMDKRHIVKNDKVKYVNIEKKVFLLTNPHPFVCHMHFAFQDNYSLCTFFFFFSFYMFYYYYYFELLL